MSVGDLLTFDWLEGSRTFSIVFGTVSSAACLALALPTLAGVVPRYRNRIFSVQTDPRQFLQLGYGVTAISMAFANALCRYIPHKPLGFTHPAFFLTTLTLVVLLAPRLLAPSLRAAAAARGLRVATPVLCAVLAAVVALPLGAVVRAFS